MYSCLLRWFNLEFNRTVKEKVFVGCFRTIKSKNRNVLFLIQIHKESFTREEPGLCKGSRVAVVTSSRYRHLCPARLLVTQSLPGRVTKLPLLPSLDLLLLFLLFFFFFSFQTLPCMAILPLVHYCAYVLEENFSFMRKILIRQWSYHWSGSCGILLSR